MGDITYMRGGIKISKGFNGVMRARFVKDAEGNVMAWQDLSLPRDIKDSDYYRILIEHGDWIPFGFSSAINPFRGEEAKGVMDYTEGGILTFVMGFKNYHKEQEAFVSLVEKIADFYYIEQDYDDTMMEPTHDGTNRRSWIKRRE